MTKVESDDLLSITKFAKAARITRQAVNKAIKEGRLKYIVISGIKFIERKEVMKFQK
jgi:hypothetical protein